MTKKAPIRFENFVITKSTCLCMQFVVTGEMWQSSGIRSCNEISQCTCDLRSWALLGHSTRLYPQWNGCLHLRRKSFHLCHLNGKNIGALTVIWRLRRESRSDNLDQRSSLLSLQVHNYRSLIPRPSANHVTYTGFCTMKRLGVLSAILPPGSGWSIVCRVSIPPPPPPSILLFLDERLAQTTKVNSRQQN